MPAEFRACSGHEEPTDSWHCERRCMWYLSRSHDLPLKAARHVTPSSRRPMNWDTHGQYAYQYPVDFQFGPRYGFGASEPWTFAARPATQYIQMSGEHLDSSRALLIQTVHARCGGKFAHMSDLSLAQAKLCLCNTLKLRRNGREFVRREFVYNHNLPLHGRRRPQHQRLLFISS